MRTINMVCFRVVTLMLIAASVSAVAQSLQQPGNRRDLSRAREQWFRRGRTIPGQTTAALRYRAYLQKLALRKKHLPGSSATWVALGPAPLASDATGLGEQDYGWVSGRATAVAVDPSDATGNTVFIGGAYGGVWKSTNAGPASANPGNVIWTALTDDQATLAVGSMAVQPWSSGLQPCVNNSGQNIVLVGTGEADSSADSYYGFGILHSADGGNTWDLVSGDITSGRSFAGLGFSKIAFSTAQPNLVVAAAAATSQGVLEGLENPVTVNRGLYYSVDCGEHWTYSYVADSSVVISPSSAVSVTYNAGAGLFFAFMRYHGFYSSSDGANWTRLLNQPGAGLTTIACPAQTASPSICPVYRGEITVVPARNEMYVWYVDANDIDQGIWKTTDGGVTWMQIDETGIINCGDIFGGCGTQDGTYNLELAAVPNCGPSDPNCGVTDLYAGAVNIFKCEISPVFPTCNPNVNPPPPPNATFLNLTHVYGCPPDFGSTAHVHAAQHAIAFSLINNNQQDVMFFANDGGIYRAPDGFTGLNTGTCGGMNLFDSLNQTLGSMTQLVGFSQSPSDPNTLLAGAQGNGSPATGSAEGSTAWQNVNEADGGYSIINPANSLEWFTENTGVSIQKCELGISCNAEDFSNGLIVSNATLGGDFGPLFTPYILDPQNFSILLVGTCRVWRGTTDGTGFVALSNDFDTGGTSSCTGNEVNQLRALASGGPIQNGLSNVIYAGTDGQGPNSTQSPTGGHVLVTTNALQGPNSWINQTGTINPSNFPISSIALDTTDPTGDTAYVTIMGFNVSHVWKTTNAGTSWTDFTANLPDAPGNAIVLDQTTRTLYMGTDTGVFSSSTAGPNWTEVGPVAMPGNTGYLPNVAVTGLAIFSASGEKLLRASTYGRGMWEYPLIQPPFQITVDQPNPLTVFAGTSGTFNLTVTPSSSYTGTVNLSCNGGTITCSPMPSTLMFTNGGSAQGFTVTAPAVPPSGYTLDVTGTDQSLNFTTPPAALTLNVVSFNLSPPLPSGITLGAPSTSGAIKVQVSAMGPFTNAVDLSCAPPLPAGVGCSFSPSSVQPTQGNPATSTLTVSTSADTPIGSYILTLNAVSNPFIPGEPTISQPFSLTVTPDFNLALNNNSASATQGFPAAFAGTLSTGNYTYPITLSCGPGAPPACTPNPTSLIPNAAGNPFTVTVESSSVGNYNFNIIAQGSDPIRIAHTAPVTFTSTSSNAGPDFAMTITPSIMMAAVNTNAVFMGTLTALDGYNSAVTLNCGAGSPNNCTPSPLTLTPASAGVPFTVTVNSATAQSYTFDIVVQGSDRSQIKHMVPVVFDTSGTLSFTDNSPQQTVNPGQSVKYNLSLAPMGGALTAPTTFACAPKSLPAGASCAFNPTQVAAGSGTTAVTLTVATSSKTPVGTSTISATATSGSLIASTTALLTVMSIGQGTGPFTINNATGTQTVAPGVAAMYTLQVSSNSGFTNTVSFSCTGLPAATSCSFSPAQVTPGSVAEPSMTTLAIATTAQVLANIVPTKSRSQLYSLALPIFGSISILLLPTAKKRRRRRWTLVLSLLMTLGFLGFSPACGGGTGVSGGQPGTPTGTYPITVIGTSGAISETAMPTVKLVVQ